MPLHRWLRSAAAGYVLPLVGIYLFVIIGDQLDFLEDNWRSATILATSTWLLAFAPAAAAVAAWEGSRVRRAGVHPGVAARSPISILLWSAWPVLAFAGVGLVFALVAVVPTMNGVPGWPDPALTGTAVVILVAWILVGFAAGRWMHPAVGIPVMLLGAWFWLAYPVALDPPWLRHLTGYNDLGGCCSTDQTFDGRVLTAQASLGAALLVAGGLAWAVRRHTLGTRALVVTIPALAVALGVTQVADLGPMAGRPRTAGLVCGGYGGFEVCVWKEHRTRLDHVAGVVVPAAQRLVRAGLPRPSRLTEGPADQRGSWRFVASRDSTDRQIVHALAVEFLPKKDPDCIDDSGWAGLRAQELVLAWLAARAGLQPGDLRRNVDDGVVAAVGRVLDRPARDQLAWFRHNHAAMTDCRLRPREVAGP